MNPPLMCQPRLPSTAFIAFSVLWVVAWPLHISQAHGSDPYLRDWGQRSRYLASGLYRQVTMHHEV